MTSLVHAAFGAFLIPLATAPFVRSARDPRRARVLAAVSAGLAFVAALVAFVAHPPSSAQAVPALVLPVGELTLHFGLDGLSLAFLPAVSVVTFAVLLATPQLDVDASTLAWVLVGLAGSALVGLSFDPLVIVVGWFFSFVPGLVEARRRSQRLVFRWLALVTVLSTACVALPAATVSLHGGALDPGSDAARLAAAGMILATMLRLGILPLHSWIPLVAERTSLPIASSTLAVPLVALVYVRLGVASLGNAMHLASPMLVALGTASAIYGAVGALGRHRMRRAMGFLTVSLNGVVFVALVAHTEASITGAVLHATSAALSTTGLLAISHAVLSRAGTDDGRHLGGIAGRSPVIATSFLLLALAFVGFPGTVGFASEDLLLQGIMRHHRAVTVALLVVMALNGITLYRFYVRVFLGPSHRRAVASFRDLLPRERVAIIGLLVLLVSGGFLPAPLVDIHRGVVEETHGRGFDRDPPNASSSHDSARLAASASSHGLEVR